PDGFVLVDAVMLTGGTPPAVTHEILASLTALCSEGNAGSSSTRDIKLCYVTVGGRWFFFVEIHNFCFKARENPQEQTHYACAGEIGFHWEAGYVSTTLGDPRLSLTLL